MFPQHPQLLSSESRSTHVRLQQANPGAQASPRAPQFRTVPRKTH